METALSKVRRLTSSKLAHQKTPATLLVALESTLDDQRTERTPTAYFASLLTTLDGTLHKKETSLEEGAVLPAELYLIALVAPFVPVPVIRANLDTILGMTAPLFPALMPYAPALRSQISLYQVVFVSLDRSHIEIQGIRQSFATVLQLCLDSRPKVRKQATETIHEVLRNAPPPLSCHPYADRVSDWVKLVLAEVGADPLVASKSRKGSQTPSTETAIHMLAFVRPIISHLPPSSLPSVTTLLLALPRLGHPYLSQSAYAILADLFFATVDDTSSGVDRQIPEVLQAITSSPPLTTDATLSPSWLRVLGSLMNAYRQLYPKGAAQEVAKVWKRAWSFLEGKDPATRMAAVECLENLSHCFSPEFIEESLGAVDNSKSSLGNIVAQTTKSLDSLAFARSMPELLAVTSVLLKSLRHRKTPTSPLAAEQLLLPLVQKVGELRTQKGFEYKEQADVALATAMQVLGPQVLLEILPLNLEPADRECGREPRAYLLPLLAQPHCAPLSHFISYFVPLSERMFDLQQAAESEGRQAEAKVWNVLVAQVWAGLSGYCHSTPDLPEALTPKFAQLLSQLLYSQVELRPSILKALKVMVDSNVVLSASERGPQNANSTIIPELAAANVAFLRTQAESWLAVFFNVFGSVSRDGRGMVGDVISAWAAIAGDEEIGKAYKKVVHLFETNLVTAQKTPLSHSSIEGGSVTAMTQDILILLLPHLPVHDGQALFGLCLSPEVLGAPDNGVQKRGYKILTKLLERSSVSVEAEAVLQKLAAVSGSLAPAAKRDRFCLLTLLVPLISSTSLHIIPSFIPEAVLGTKEPSEKARCAAFDLIVAMGRKMGEGGVVKRNLVDGMDEDGAGDATANIEEFMTMVAGGLAGASPHMISATVTAISRLVFEFKDAVSEKMQNEIFTTLLVFLVSANREIVKSVLGFVKLAIHTLPMEVLRPHLGDLVPVLLKWSHDHKNHFKVKVRHIFERLLRRFAWDEVYAFAGEEEAAKVLVNIKKRKERAKRKKAARGLNEETGHEEHTTKPLAGTAFEDVLYGSESELEDSDDDDNEGAPPTRAQTKSKLGSHGARLLVDDDDPMDLLSGVASRITNTQKSRRRKPGQEAAHFKTDESGKMIIDGEKSDEETEGPRDILAGDAYKESVTSVDGFTRGANGRVKFHKDTKKRRREEVDADMDTDMADADTARSRAIKGNNKRKTESKLGHEFKAKKAGGDVKKGGMDPYAYLSLSQAAKKGRRGSIGIAGRH